MTPLTTSARVLRDYQVEAVQAVEAYWTDSADREADRHTPVVVLPTGTGKPLSDDTEIPTPGGFVPMGDIRPGSYVFGVDGEPTKVLAVDPQGVIDLYRVTFDDGASVLAGPGHLWTVQRKGRKPRTMTTMDILAAGFKDGDGYMWRVPVAEPVQYMDRSQPLDPYLAGSLLANGHVVHGSSAVLATPDLDVVENIRRRGVTVQDATYGTSCPRWTFPGLAHTVTRSGIRGPLSSDKSIPEHYLTASTADRWDLLRGLMDGDGSTRAGGRRSVAYHTTSKALASDVKSLAWSLGVRASISAQDRTHDGKLVEYTVHMLPPAGVSLFSTSRKDQGETPRRTFAPRRSLVSIELETSGPATCIQVSNSDGLFCATRDYIVTHNSTVIASLAVRWRATGYRVAMLAHRRELLDQMAASVMAVDPEGEHVGIVQADRDDPSTAIVAASFQTLQNDRRLASLGHRDVVLCDEAHHASADTYLGVLDRLGVLDGTALACGFTATASRADGGLGRVWDTVVYERSLKWAIQEGYLITPRGLTVVLDDLDLSKVHVRGGDYASGELAEAMESSVDTTVDAVLRHAPGRACIVFAAGVEHAEALAEGLTSRGVRAAAVTGAMSTDDRESVYTLFRSGELDAMVTVQVLTEGADFPRCDCVVMARPTRSQTLYTQMVGRAVRLYPGKQDALVLDLAGTMRDLSLVTLTDLTPEAEHRRVSPTSDEDPGQTEPKPPRPQRIGPATLEDFDLLAVSPANWLQTPGGVLYLDIGRSGYVFCWPPASPEVTEYQVGVIHRPQHSRDGWLAEGRAMDLQAARDLAEAEAPRYGELPSREASWRKKGQPSAAQIRLARSLRIPDVDRKNRARLSDDISTAKASRVLDLD